MNLKNQKPIFIPHEYWAEIEGSMSKAALMDMAWDYATQLCGSNLSADILKDFRDRAAIIRLHRRNQAKDSAQ